METNAHGQPADPPLALRRPTVSAVICTVDRPVLLRQAIRSIREQRYDGVIETVVVFDGTAPDQSLNSDDAERPVTVMANKMCIRDRFLPRQFVSRGDRLVFSNGILMLAGLAIALLIVFRGDTSALIPLYAVGVFTGFTLSQTGMVRHHLKLKEPNWKRKAVVNGVGAVMTAVVLAVVVVSKFTIGAWVPVVMIPMVVLGFRMVSEHYRRAVSYTHLDVYKRQGRS